jgi:hypothetical protein
VVGVVVGVVASVVVVGVVVGVVASVVVVGVVVSGDGAADVVGSVGVVVVVVSVAGALAVNVLVVSVDVNVLVVPDVVLVSTVGVRPAEAFGASVNQRASPTTIVGQLQMDGRCGRWCCEFGGAVTP